MSEARTDPPRRQRPETARVPRIIPLPADDPPPISDYGIAENLAGTTDDTPTIVSSSPRKTPAPLADGGIRGKKLAHFELLEQIGAGGMAAVLRARDTQLDRIVALKILPPDMATDPENVRRFQQEARSAAKLDHENIARVFFCGEDQRLHFIAFEFVEGDNLRTVLERRGRLPVGLAVPYIIQVAAGLAHAAERGIVHRDIKPSNIIITPSGRAKLVDMGLARTLGPRKDQALTQSGVTLGTFDYISPEQALEPRDADVRSDIYSLGCTFYHMVTGRPPVPEGTAAKKLHCHQHVPPPDPRELAPGVPDEIAIILDRMMAKDPRDRYQNADELVQHLLTAAKKLNVGADVPEGVLFVEAPLPRTGGSRPYLLVGLAVAAVAALIMFLDLPTVPVPTVPPPPPGTQEASKVSPKGGPENKTTGDTEPVVPLATQPDVAQTVAIIYDQDWDPARLAKWLDDNKGKNHLTITLARDLELDSNQTAPLVVRARNVTLQAKAGIHPKVKFLYPDKPLTEWTALTVEADQAEISGIQFLLDGRQGQVFLTALKLKGGKDHHVKQCEFVQANPPPLGSEGRMDSLVLEKAASDMSVVLEESIFFGFNSYQEGVFDVGGTGGKSAVVLRNGPLTMKVVNCAFGPHATIFSVDGDLDNILLEHCSVMLGEHWSMRLDGQPVTVPSSVFEVLDPESKPTLEARHCLFARVSGSDSDGAAFVRGLDGGEPVRFSGRDNRFYNIPLLVAGKSQGENQPLAEYLQKKSGPDAPGQLLAVSPWKDKDLKALRTPGTTLPVSTFKPNDKLRDMRADYNSATHLVGVETLAGESLTANLPLLRDVFTVDPSLAEERPGYTKGLPAAVLGVLAVVGENSQRTILLRHNGELTVDNPILLRSEKDEPTDLTIKPARGFRPILTLGNASERDAALFLLHDGVRLHLEGMEIRLRPGGKFDSQSIASLIGDGEITFKDCLLTLDPAEQSTRLAVASLPSNGKRMKKDNTMPVRTDMDRKARVLLTNCVLRGFGDLIWDQAGRGVHLETSNVLAALSGSLANLEGGSGQSSTLKLTRTTTFLGGHVLRTQAADFARLPHVDVSASACFFTPAASSNRSLVRVEVPSFDFDKWKTHLNWEAPQSNAYGPFEPWFVDLLAPPEGAEGFEVTGSPTMILDAAGWQKFSMEGNSHRYKIGLAEKISPEEGAYLKVQPGQLRPEGVTDTGVDGMGLPKMGLGP